MADADLSPGTHRRGSQVEGKTVRDNQQDCQVDTRLQAMVAPMGLPRRTDQPLPGS